MIFTAAGSQFFIGEAVDMPRSQMAAGDFAAVDWTEVTSLESLGSIGVQRGTADSSHLGFAYQQVRKTQYLQSPMQLVCAIDVDDDGQQAMYAACIDDRNYTFRLILPNGDKRLFAGMVTQALEVFDDVNAVSKMTYAIAINSNIVRA